MKNVSPKMLSKYPQFNIKLENQQKEDVYKMLVRGEARINRSNSQKRLLAALIRP